MEKNTENTVDLSMLLREVCMNNKTHPVLVELDLCLQKLAPSLDCDDRNDIICSILAKIHYMQAE